MRKQLFDSHAVMDFLAVAGSFLVHAADGTRDTAILTTAADTTISISNTASARDVKSATS